MCWKGASGDLWAERFDSDIADLFTLQNEITGRLANTLDIEMTAAEAARPTEEPDALDYILRGRAATLKPNSPESWAEAIRHIGGQDRSETADSGHCSSGAISSCIKFT
jgi:hypothetical protein